jgi:hypothetical protein
VLAVASQLPIGTRLEKWFCATYAREQTVKRWREGIKAEISACRNVDVVIDLLRTIRGSSLDVPT